MLHLWEILGTLVFCVSGAIAAREKEMDWFGMFVVGLITGTGGGLLRSVLIGDVPPRMLTDPLPFLLALGAVVIALLGAAWWRKIRRVVSTVDALGLGLFTVTGIRIAESKGLPWWSCLALGVITATFGGLLRDVLRNDVPLVLRKEIYATASLIGGLAMLGMTHLRWPDGAVLVTTTAIIVTIRLLAIRYAIHQSQDG
ncbi:TRIC cation channel family protein [Luteolibacter flavescens]|uniref:TRIC cation channel family protein n=1 Tax=Luteolibacter flavescens TaxID=1859460 RepID=A0ABT3FKZ2_9BACT|nr:TRIC cation channel family protein [Luteolibacter flavescens]MCW1884244.1 TRIC cation channel family protein [Luteolibacter flavescens]